MAEVDTETITLAALEAAYNAASAGGDKFTPGDRTFLHIKNGSAGSVTATITTPNQVAGLAIDDAAVVVPAGEERFVGPFVREHFAASDGLGAVAWSDETSVTFAVINL